MEAGCPDLHCSSEISESLWGGSKNHIGIMVDFDLHRFGFRSLDMGAPGISDSG